MAMTVEEKQAAADARAEAKVEDAALSEMRSQSEAATIEAARVEVEEVDLLELRRREARMAVDGSASDPDKEFSYEEVIERVGKGLNPPTGWMLDATLPALVRKATDAEMQAAREA